MRRSRIRFLFAQLSAFVAFFVSVGIVLLVLGRVFDLRSWASEWPGSAIQMAGVVGAVVAVGCIGMLAVVLWGRLLVAIGLLTREEARGYPYSRPWETVL
jgi:hypothetical protein